MLLPEVAVAIEGWTPTTFSPPVAAFAREVVVKAAPARPARAKALLFAAARLGAFGVALGGELDPSLLAPALVERFVETSTAAPATLRTLASNLRVLARGLSGEPPARRLPRERAKPPYSPCELASYLALCDAQPTELRRQRLSALISLGAGAGLVGSELRSVAGSDVARRFGGVTVTVEGRRARTVPVLAPFHERLCEAVSFFGEGRLLCPDPERHNVTDPIVGRLSGGADLERLSTSRLRSTYLVQMAETIGLRAFMDAAGITCSQRLGDLVAGLSPRSEEEAVALLGGRR